MAEAIYEYDKTDIDLMELSKDIENDLPSVQFVLRKLHGQANIKVVCPSALSSEDITTLDNAVTAHKSGYPSIVLEKAKNDKINAIDARTEELISSGFTYNSTKFSLSSNAQLNASGVEIAESKSWNTYPMGISTDDPDSPEYEVVDATDLDSYYSTGLGTKKAHLDSGRDLKKQVSDATDIAGVDAVVDNR